MILYLVCTLEKSILKIDYFFDEMRKTINIYIAIIFNKIGFGFWYKNPRDLKFAMII